MKIGLTYDLRQAYLDMGFGEEETAEFDRPDTIEAIESALQQLGYETDRIGHLWELVRRLNQGDRWDMVFNIAEGLYGMGREAAIPALLDAYRIPYAFSDPLVLALSLQKSMTKRVLRDLGIATPDFVEITSTDQLAAVKLPYPLFAKPVGEGTGKGINPASKINDADELETVCHDLLATFKQPVLVETFLPGREFTVGIVGTGESARSVGVMEVILNASAEQHAYTYVNKEECEERVTYKPVCDADAKHAKAAALASWRGLGCRDAGRVDIRLDADGVANVMELNPLAGLHPEHSDLPIICTFYGIPYLELMQSIMDSAMERLEPVAQAQQILTVQPEVAVAGRSAAY